MINQKLSYCVGLVLAALSLSAAPAYAQVPEDDVPIIDLPDIEVPDPDAMPKTDTDDAEATALPDKPDYSHLPPLAERAAKLDALFVRLKAEEDEDAASLIAEEIWAIWLDSGSPSVNLTLRRGTAAEKRTDIELARRMYDHVTSLQPDYAEGWARSARLAYSENDLNRCVHDVMQALVLEPRHFYAMWTLGNALEKLGRNEEALAAYREAQKLYPALKEVNTQVETLQNRIEGEVL